MNEQVRPEHGGRVELRRGEATHTPDASSLPEPSAADVVYQAIWSTRACAWRGTVTIAGGQVSLSVTDSSGEEKAPPTWLTEWTLQLVRTTLRSAALDPEAELPRRLTRWRAAPEER